MPRRKYAWEKLSDEQLLKQRFRSLRVTVEDTWLEDCLGALYEELQARGIRLRPHTWISSEWFSPADVPGIAIPFYLAHPRLMKLEKKMMLEVEGGTWSECMAILRHETGHAMQHAYQLQRRRRWQQLFGPSSKHYPLYYRPDPASRRYVQHLRRWYAQSHPDEDFAETFAVWLRPRSNWRTRYAGWPALKKLEYVDELMGEIAGKRPLVTTRERADPLHKLSQTLGEHYQKKQAFYAFKPPKTYDRDLSRLFSADPRHRRVQRAAVFIRRHRAQVRQLVARWTGENQLTLDAVLDDMISRCRELDLRAPGSEPVLGCATISEGEALRRATIMNPRGFATAAALLGGLLVLSGTVAGSLARFGLAAIENTGAVLDEHLGAASLAYDTEPAVATPGLALGNAGVPNTDIATIANSVTTTAAATISLRYERESTASAGLTDSAQPPPETPPVQVAAASTSDLVPNDAEETFSSVKIFDECVVADSCVDHYLWALYERAPKLDTIKVYERRKVTVKKKGKTVTLTRTVAKRINEDFTWKDSKAAEKSGMSMMDYVIGGMDRSFKLKLFNMLGAAEQAGLSPGITSAFRDDYRQSIASGLKAATDRSYHGGSFRGGYGHGLAADAVSVKGATREQRWISTENLWKWIDAHEHEFGIGRPYLDKDPPHLAPIEGREYAAHRGKTKAQHAVSDTKKRLAVRG
jgi:hypothetical protein